MCCDVLLARVADFLPYFALVLAAAATFVALRRDPPADTDSEDVCPRLCRDEQKRLAASVKFIIRLKRKMRNFKKRKDDLARRNVDD